MNIDNIKIKKLEHSEVEISAEVSAEDFESFRKDSVAKLSKNVNIDGFRKGNVPEAVLIKNVGDMAILEDMADKAVSKAYTKILIDNAIKAIGNPSVSITKIAKGEALGFKIVTAVMPEVELGDYKKIAGKVSVAKAEEATASEKEVAEVVDNVRKHHAVTVAPKQNEGAEKENSTEDKKKADLPELTDELVKEFGDFKTVADFKDKIKENIILEKKNKAQQKKRMEIMEGIISDSKMEVPKVVVESELDKMMTQFEGDIARMGLNFEEYLKHIKKTTDDLRKEWVPDAEKNSKVQIILNKIAVEEKILPDDKKVKEETSRLMEQYKDASEERAKSYVETILTNEAVFEFLENQK